MTKRQAAADFIFVTTNDHKVQVAQLICGRFGVSFTRKNLELVEIQDNDGTVIARQKAQQAYQVYNKPVVVSDSSWIIPGLKGFPGPYMKQMNHWLTSNDFLNLTKPLKNRRIIYRQILAYKDKRQEKIFSVDIDGVLLDEVRGTSVYPAFSIISFDRGKHSLAEADALGQPASANHYNAWHELCEWLKQ